MSLAKFELEIQKTFQDVLIDEAEYDGIPSWLTARGYFSGRISNYFQQLYTEHRAEFSRVWREIALRFRDKNSVLGYELMNEPWTGDFYQVTVVCKFLPSSLSDRT